MPGTVYVPVADLVRVLTLPTALKFVEHFGGVSLYVQNASRLTPESAIVRAIGLEAARQLAEEWGQLDVMVPRCAAYLRTLRNQALRADRAELSVRQCALKYELTERGVYQILAGEEEPLDDGAAPGRKQGQLF